MSGAQTTWPFMAKPCILRATYGDMKCKAEASSHIPRGNTQLHETNLPFQIHTYMFQAIEFRFSHHTAPVYICSTLTAQVA